MRLEVAEVVDGDDLDVGAPEALHGAEEVAADAAEAVDAHANSHGSSPRAVEVGTPGAQASRRPYRRAAGPAARSVRRTCE